MRDTIRAWILMILWVFIINLSFYYNYNLDHWLSLIFGAFAGGSLGWFIGYYFLNQRSKE